MLTASQTKIFLTNYQDFILTRGYFYSQKIYKGLEEFDSGLEETAFRKELLPKEAMDEYECKTFPKIRETLWEELCLTVGGENRVSKEFITNTWIYIQRYFNCQKACDYDAKVHVFNCLKTWKEINDFIENLAQINVEFKEACNGGVYSSAWEWQKKEIAKRRREQKAQENREKQQAQKSKKLSEEAFRKSENSPQQSKSNSPTVSANFSPSQVPVSPTNSPAETSQEEPDQPEVKFKEGNSAEETSRESPALSQSSASPEKLFLTGGVILAFFLAGVILFQRKKSKINNK